MASGFAKAPISRSLCLFTAGASIFSGFLGGPDLFCLDVSNTFGKLQLWRLFTCHFVFSNPAGIFFGISLMYIFREFERRFKSSKYLVAVLILMVLSTSIQLILLFTGAVSKVSPGPFAIIFGLFTFFFSDIPPSAKGAIFFIPMSDKTFTYLFGIQLMFSNYPYSCWPALCGIAAGILYRSSLLPFRRLRLPARCQSFCEWYCSYFDLRAPPRRQGGYHQVPENDPTMPQQLFGPPPAVPMVAPDPDSVQRLVDMGFDEARARYALSRTQNNLEAAVGLLGM